MAKLEEMKVGEVYKGCEGIERKILFADSKNCYTEILEDDTTRGSWDRWDVEGWTLVKPERELWHWRIQNGKHGYWFSDNRLFCDDGLDGTGVKFYENWHSLEKEKLTALGSVKVEEQR